MKRGVRSTVETYLPEHRRDWRHRSRGYWMERAQRMGTEIEQLVDAVFAADDVHSQLRRVQAIVTHLEAFPPERARAAARRALHFGSLDYRSIKNILRQGLDLKPLAQVGTKAWSKGARFARKPTETLFAHKESLYVHD